MQDAVWARYTWDGSVVFDSSGSALHVNKSETGTAALATTDCRDLQCLQLSEGAYLKFPAHNFGRYVGLSFSLWFKPSDGAGSFNTILDFGNDDSAPRNNIVISRHAGEADLVLQVFVAGEKSEILVRQTWQAGVWRHIVWTLSPTSSYNSLHAAWKVYVDGAFVADKLGYYPVSRELQLNYIGKSNFEGRSGFSGHLDTFVMYRKAISADEARGLSIVSCRFLSFT